MLLLAGFLIAGTAIMAIGAYSVLQQTETQVTTQEHDAMLNLFLNTRDRAKAYFTLVSANDTAASVDHHLDGYLQSQYQTAHSLSLELNATLAGADTRAQLSERNNFTDAANQYATDDGDPLWAIDGAECYSQVSYDGNNDGLITDANGDVLAAIFWLKVQGIDASLEEYIIIDVPSTSGPGC